MYVPMFISNNPANYDEEEISSKKAIGTRENSPTHIGPLFYFETRAQRWNE